jgi:hypothetical protein
MIILKNAADHFVGAGHAGARTKVFHAREQLGEPCVGAGHARDCFFVRGQHPQEVRRGCKGLITKSGNLLLNKLSAKLTQPQQHTQGPLLRKFIKAT